MPALQFNKFIYENLKSSGRQVEPPMAAFTRMGYSYLHNDWISFLSSGLTLIAALVMITIGHFNSNT